MLAMLRRRTHHRGHRPVDRGMTLIEVVMSVLILGTISVFVVGAISVVFRTQSGVTNTTAASHDVQQAVSFFHQDIQSAPYELSAFRATTGTTGDTGSGCDDAGNDNVLRFDTDDRRIAYRLVSTGDTAELDRLECVQSGGSWIVDSSVNIADALDTSNGAAVTAAVIAESADPTAVDRVVLSFASNVLGDQEISATPRAATLVETPPTVSECTSVDPLDATENFQTFVQGDVHLIGASIKQTLAVGGTLSFEGNVSVGQNLSSATDYPSAPGFENVGLYAGSIDWGNTPAGSTLQVYSGADAAIADVSGSDWATQGARLLVFEDGDSSRDPQIRLQNGGQLVTGSEATTIEEAFEALQGCASLLGGLPDGCSCAEFVGVTATNGSTYQGTEADSAVSLELDSSAVNVLNMTEDQLADLTSLKFDPAPTATSPLIINVDTDADVTFTPITVQGGGSTASSIIWNFPNATGTITVEGTSSLWGTLLAPSATVVSDVNIEGGVVAAMFVFSGSNLNPSRSFEGEVPWD